MERERRIYLDNAATTWPKPEPVYAAVERYLRDNGAPAGRSAYREAALAERILADARRRAAAIVGAADPRQVVFTSGGTDSLNLALHGLLQPGDHVVTSAAEHNSVLRPLRHLERTCGVAVTRIPCDGQGILSLDDLQAAVTPKTRLVALIHASNVTGALQPIEEAGKIARQCGALFLLDAAQSLGHMPFDAVSLGADLVAAPAHKGLLAPLGLGLLYIAPGVEEALDSFRQGGTGTRSELDTQPETLPEKYEPGNHNMPALAGLAAALEWISQRGIDALWEHERQLAVTLIDGLAAIDGVTVLAPAARRVGVVSFTVAGADPQEIAAMLDAAGQVQVRAGLHCAPLMHQALGTAEQGGTVRMSLGPFVTQDDLDRALATLEEIVSAVH